MEPVTPQIVKVKISGSTSKDLEFVFRDSIIASGSQASGGFESTVLLNVAGQSADILIREKGSSITLESWKISPALFNQSFSIYYDGTGVYDGAVSYHIKGYATSGELEFLLDGQVKGEGSLKIENTFSILINKGQSRMFEVRKKGETVPLISKVINASPATGQSLNFFFDGEKIVDNVKLSPPANPNNMAISAQFNPNFQGSLPPTFSGDAELDLVFYIRNTDGVVTDPNIRITMPTDGRFVDFELPSLSDENSLYTFDICKKGTHEIPYSNFPSEATSPPKQSMGYYGELVFGTIAGPKYFEPGASKLLLLGPTSRSIRSPTRFRAVYGTIFQDLSEYFQ
ncbi:hypothetical protein [Pedobacter alluvionis]|uniref:Uncharacterized protein n=1 Tax=Pedobacter alluvionis TaxID=475253 RepID=A0ABY2HK89_9SPHI|nr:hypothetical protein [Pedobacter alluvionis]TFB28369.1 hypothetical protein E3V97_23080 [Pedobacter alluvionis]